MNRKSPEGEKVPWTSTSTREAEEVYTQNVPSASTGTTAKLATERPTVTLAFD
jgi:hypothetical protein